MYILHKVSNDWKNIFKRNVSKIMCNKNIHVLQKKKTQQQPPATITLSSDRHLPPLLHASIVL